MSTTNDPSREAKRKLRRAEMAAQNALELVRFGRLSPTEGAPHAIAHAERVYRLRRYPVSDTAPRRIKAPVLLVPPLMVTSEVYDVAPDISAVRALGDAGVDVWLCDFGSPEHEEGGMARTLDDHVRAVVDAIRRVHTTTGEKVHVAGYSQGGMFVYQAAAFLRCEGIASLVTFGSPVDIHKNLPGVSAGALEQLIRVATTMIERPLERIEGLPGFLTSTGFKLLSVRKEVDQIVDFWRKIHDRDALARRESRRRFLAGDGFVAWPGPALRKFVEEFIVHNRLLEGGFVIDGRTVTLADIDVPILAFLGTRDEIARPAAILAVRDAAPQAEVYAVPLPAGHFGLVVGSLAMQKTWPTVVDWMDWRERRGPRPALIPKPKVHEEVDPEDLELGSDIDVELFYEAALDTMRGAWKKLGELTEDAGDLFDSVRYQLPQLGTLERLRSSSRVGLSVALAEQAKRHPDATFFLYQGRAFTYAQADQRVTAVTKGFLSLEVRPGQRVALLMESRPSFLTAVAALNRLGAVAVVLPHAADEATLRTAIAEGEGSMVVTDPENARRARAAFEGTVVSLGGATQERALPDGVRDMEAIDPEAVELPRWYVPNPGHARDLAMVLFSRGRGGEPRASRVTNGRFATSAFGASAGCTLTPNDTVYCCLPLHHPTGLLVAVGSAVVAGARLAIGSPFSVETFWAEAHRYGATVAFYAGDMVRALVDAERRPIDQRSALRLFAGSGMRDDVWDRVGPRFGDRISVMEFYASTEANLVLANASGERALSLGRPLPGSAEIAVLAYDFSTRTLRRDPWGRGIACGPEEAGLLAAKLDADARSDAALERRLAKDVFTPGDGWFLTSDVVAVDRRGNYRFVDREPELRRVDDVLVSARAVEDAALTVPGLGRVCALRDAADELVLVVELRDHPDAVSRMLRAVFAERLAPVARPRRVLVTERIPVHEGYRPLLDAVREALPSLSELAGATAP